MLVGGAVRRPRQATGDPRVTRLRSKPLSPPAHGINFLRSSLRHAAAPFPPIHSYPSPGVREREHPPHAPNMTRRAEARPSEEEAMAVRVCPHRGPGPGPPAGKGRGRGAGAASTTSSSMMADGDRADARVGVGRVASTERPPRVLCVRTGGGGGGQRGVSSSEGAGGETEAQLELGPRAPSAHSHAHGPLSLSLSLRSQWPPLCTPPSWKARVGLPPPRAPPSAVNAAAASPPPQHWATASGRGLPCGATPRPRTPGRPAHPPGMAASATAAAAATDAPACLARTAMTATAGWAAAAAATRPPLAGRPS